MVATSYRRTKSGPYEKHIDEKALKNQDTRPIHSRNGAPDHELNTDNLYRLAAPDETTEAAELAETSDLKIFVSMERDAGTTYLSYEVSAKDPGLGLSDTDLGEIELKLDPQEYFAQFFKEIARHLNRRPAACQALLDDKSAYLSRSLLPPALRECLWELQDRITTVEVLSEEGWIPWEFLRLQYQNQSGWNSGPFLCEAFALTRWRADAARSLRLPLRNVGLVVCQRANLPASRSEAMAIELLFRQAGRQLQTLSATYHDLIRNLGAGDLEGIHLISHGFGKANNPDLSAVVLDDGLLLTPESLAGEASNLGRARPLVFLNACHTGRGAQALTDVGGWAAQFLSAGAGAFLGTSWATTDQAASDFAESFYRDLLHGVPIGEAMRQARLKIREAFPGDLTWLAYTLFAHPLATCSKAPGPSYPPLRPARKLAGSRRLGRIREIQLFTNSAAKRRLRDRQNAIDNIRCMRIENQLRSALRGGLRLEIRLKYHSEYVLRPWVEADRSAVPSSLLEAFNQRGRAILVLGEPGAGKSVALLELVRKLLADAVRDPIAHIPIFLELDSWAVRRLPIEEWLIEELHQLYRIPRRTSQAWIANEQLCLLLDGLDCIREATDRQALVDAINSCPLTMPIAITCRLDEYQQLNQPLDLADAVVLEALSDEQIEHYLAAKNLSRVRDALEEHANLKSIAVRPLFLATLQGISKLAK